MKINSVGEMIVSENDIVEHLYLGESIVSDIVVDDSSWIEQYNSLMTTFDLADNVIPWHEESNLLSAEFVDSCVGIDGWYMPDAYKELDMYKYLTDLCTTPTQIERVATEYVEYEKRNMIPVLKFLVYFIETLEKNDVVWGVGRGSSVSSYILFLLRVHRIDSLKYDLDIKEFLK